MLLLFTDRKGGRVASLGLEFAEGLDTACDPGNEPGKKLQLRLALPRKGMQPVGCEH